MSETAWLIEHQDDDGPLFYWCGSPLGCGWISSAEPYQTAHLLAIRFGRKEDAEAVATHSGLNFTRIAEHAWIAIPTS